MIREGKETDVTNKQMMGILIFEVQAKQKSKRAVLRAAKAVQAGRGWRASCWECKQTRGTGGKGLSEFRILKELFHVMRPKVWPHYRELRRKEDEILRAEKIVGL